MRLARLINAKRGKLFFSFGAIQVTQLLLPLLALPWLGRILEPESFGLLMYMALFPQGIALIMEWGLTLGGARSAAWKRDDDRALATLLGAVFSAKMLLALFCAGAVIAAFPLVPHAREYPAAFFLAACSGIIRGCSPFWFYQGTSQDVRQLAIWDVSSSLCALALILVFIHAPGDWQGYFFIDAICKGIAYAWLYCHLWRRYAPGPDFTGALNLLGGTLPLFMVSLSQAICIYGAQMVIGWFLAPAQMGIVIATGKMLRALGRLANPLTQTVFPEICVLRNSQPAVARRILRLSLLVTFAFLFIGGACIWALAPWILRLALGEAYVWGAPILRIMILGAPLMAFGHVLGTQTLVSFGQEKSQMTVYAIVATLSLPLVAIFTSQWGIMGAAWAPVCIEGALACGLFIAVCIACPHALWKKTD